MTEFESKTTNVLINEIQATVSWHEAGDLLSVFDQLNTDTLSDGRVGLFGLKTTANREMT